MADFEQLLECSICLGEYDDPRSLPCLHTFCKSCLEGAKLTNQDGYLVLPCPTCRTPTRLPPEGISGFLKSFHIINLKEFLAKNRPTIDTKRNCDHCNSLSDNYCSDCKSYYCRNCDSLHKECDKQPTQTQDSFSLYNSSMKASEMCILHRKPLDMFCVSEGCRETICRTCANKEHKDHISACKPIEDAVDEQRELIMDELSNLQTQLDNIDGKLKLFTCRESEIAEQSDTVKAQIHSRAEYLINTIHTSEEGLARKVDEVISSKLGALTDKKQSIESTQEVMKNLKESVELCLKTGDPQEIFKTSKRWIPKINKVVQSIQNDDWNPTEVADLSFVPIEKEDTFSDLGNLSSTFAGACSVELIKRSMFVDKSPDIHLVYSIKYSSKPSYVVIPLSHIKCSMKHPAKGNNTNAGMILKANIEKGNAPCEYIVKFCPSSNGTYHIYFNVDDMDTEPQSILVPFNPLYLSSITPTAIMKFIRKPIGLAVAEDKRIIVLNDFQEVVILDRFGCNPKIYSRPEGGNRFTSTRHAAVTPDNCFIMTDKYSILKVTMDGRLVASVGKRGSGPLQFDNPFGITIDRKSGQIYVAELYNHRVQVLNPDFSFSHFIGSSGTGLGQFNQPNGTALDSQGNVFVTDTFNHRIQKFSQTGEYLFHFGSEGASEGQLKYPEKIVIDNDYIYVTEHSNSRVSVFSTEGKFILCFGKRSSEGGLIWPRGLTFDSDGSLYVCDFRGHCIYKY